MSFKSTASTRIGKKQVKTNIGLADTLIPSSFIYFIYMGSTGSCDSIKIIFGDHIYRQHTILNIKFGVNRLLHVLKTPVYHFDLYGRYRTLWTVEDHFVLFVKFGVNRMFHVLKTLVYRFDLYGRYRIPWTDIIHFQYRPMGNRSLCANFQVCSSLFSDAIVFTTDGHTDGRTDRQTQLKCLRILR